MVHFTRIASRSSNSLFIFLRIFNMAKNTNIAFYLINNISVIVGFQKKITLNNFRALHLALILYLYQFANIILIFFPLSVPFDLNIVFHFLYDIYPITCCFNSSIKLFLLSYFIKSTR